MEHRVKCEHCGASLSVDIGRVGTACRCTACKKSFVVPLTNVRAGLVQGNFWVQRRIGLGNIGETFVVKGTTGDEKSYMKVLSRAVTADRAAADRFLAEMTRWTIVKDPGIVSIETAGKLLDHLCIITRHVEGEFLNHRVAQEGRMAQAEVVATALAVAKILGKVHDSFGFVHGDIRPTNIMCNKKGRTFLFDPGNHKYLLSAGSLSQLNHRSDVAQYLSPQASNDPALLEPASDIYSLGATMFYLLSGRPPIMGGDPDKIMTEKTTKPPANVTEFASDVQPGIAALIERMMSPKPSERPQSWNEVKELLEKGDFEKVPRSTKRRMMTTKVMDVIDEDSSAADRKMKLSLGLIGILSMIFLVGAGLAVLMTKPSSDHNGPTVRHRISDKGFAEMCTKFREQAMESPERIKILTSQLVKLLNEIQNEEQRAKLKALVSEINRPSNLGRFRRPKRDVAPLPGGKQPMTYEHWTFADGDDFFKGRSKGLVLTAVGSGVASARGIFYSGVSIPSGAYLKTDDLKLSLNKPFTWAVWFCARKQGSIMTCDGPTGSLRLDMRRDGIQFSTGSKVLFKHRYNPLIGRWVHVAVSYDGNCVTLYLNGHRKYTRRKKLGSIHGDCDFRIGGGGFNGVVDEAMLFDCCLSSVQIRHVTSGVQMYPIVLQSSGLVARWPLPESITSKMPGAKPLTGTAIEPEGSAFRFSPSDGIDCMALDRSKPLDELQMKSFTIAAWYKPQKAADNRRRGYECIVSKNAKVKTSTGGLRDCPLYLRFLPSGCFQAEIWVDGEAQLVQSEGKVSYEGWSHVVMCVAGGKLKLYVNGRLEGARQLPPGKLPQPEYAEAPWHIGAHMTSKGLSFPANGLIDQVLFFARPLSDREIRALTYAK